MASALAFATASARASPLAAADAAIAVRAVSREARSAVTSPAREGPSARKAPPERAPVAMDKDAAAGLSSLAPAPRTRTAAARVEENKAMGTTIWRPRESLVAGR